MFAFAMDINDWTLSGGGMEGESYFSESRPDLIMKVYTDNRPLSFVEAEFRKMKMLQESGISIPEPCEVTRYNSHPAIISRRIMHKKSFARLCGEHPEMIPSLAGRMARMIKGLHGKQADLGVFESVLGRYGRLLEANTALDERDKEQVSRALDAIRADDRGTLVHGDFHFGNIITGSGRDFFIDLGDISFGHPNHDLAMFYITTHYGCPHSFGYLYHMTWEQALAFWDAFKTCYYEKEISDGEVFAQLRNYMLARSIWFKSEEIQVSLCSILLHQDNPLRSEVRLKSLGE